MQKPEAEEETENSNHKTYISKAIRNIKELLFDFGCSLENHHNLWQILLTVIAIAVAGFVYFITKEQVRIANTALGYQRISDSINGVYQWKRDSTTSAKTDSSLSLTRRSNERAERFGKDELRAYVNFKSISDFDPRVNEPVSYFIEFINTGKTPAYNVRYFSQWKTGTGLWPNEAKYTKEMTSKCDNEVLVGAGLPCVIKFGDKVGFRVFRKIDSLAIYSGGTKLFILGMITYNDKFGDNHFTWFAYEYDISGNVWKVYKRYNNSN